MKGVSPRKAFVANVIAGAILIALAIALWRDPGLVIRAEFAKQRKTYRDAAEVLGVTDHTIGRRMSGLMDFGLSELVVLAEWLDVPIERLIAPLLNEQAAS